MCLDAARWSVEPLSKATRSTFPTYLADPEYTWTEAVKRGGLRTMLGVPLLRGGTPIGVMGMHRLTVRPFTDKQIDLVTTFADQAVIAIENVRLFNEVQARTRELARSVGELQALGEVSQAVNSTVDLETVLTTIVAKATQLSSTEAGAIYVFDDANQEFRLRATYGLDEKVVAELRDSHIRIGETAISGAVERRLPIQIPDIQADASATLDVIVRAGFRALLIVPLLSPDAVVGALVVRRKQPGEFPKSIVELLQTFAAQSVLAIQNARLFSEIEEKSRQLAAASQHKSQFLANMSHELRTPLNAIIGVTEMLREDAEASKQDLEPLDRVLGAGRHLLALINDILDLSKIEAGRMELQLEDFALAPLIDNVVKTIEPLAAKNGNQVAVHCRRCDRDDACRPDATAAGTVEPREQRQQVHRPRHRHHRRAARARGWPRLGHHRGRRHRHRHDGGADGQAVPGILPGRCLHDPQIRWHRALGSRSANASAR